MIIVALMGGIGNQMFQYSCGRALSLKKGADLLLDHGSFRSAVAEGSTRRKYELDAFGIGREASVSTMRLLPVRQKLRRLLPFECGFEYVSEGNPYAADTIFPSRRSLYISGYFQSAKYFQDISDTIRHDFTFVKSKPEYTEVIDYVRGIKDSVGVLVRRDDYISLGSDVLLKQVYYLRAMNFMRSTIENPHFLIFTIGDTGWAKETFPARPDTEIIENDDPDLIGFEKMRLLSLCKHNIIANSSFGWWSAWLNGNPEKVVVAPRCWVNDPGIDAMIARDRIPAGWHQV